MAQGEGETHRLSQLDKVYAYVHWPIGSEEAQSDETMPIRALHSP